MRTLLKRWWFWVVAVLVAAGIGIGALFVYGGQSTITQTNFDRIQFAMTQAEVEEILGHPVTRDYLSDGRVADYWVDGPSEIRVVFRVPPTVQMKDYQPGTAWQVFKYRLRQCLGLRQEPSSHIYMSP
jgi:hypothetical protein